jgi:hypothetical protein
VSYFRPPKIRKTGPRSICSLPDSTQNLSRKRGWVIPAKCALSECLKLGVQSIFVSEKSDGAKPLKTSGEPGRTRTSNPLIKRPSKGN